MRWADLNPKLKRPLVIAGALSAVSALVLLLSSGERDRDTQQRHDVIRNVLTDRDTRTVGLDSLAASIKDLQSKANDQTRRMQKMERDLDLAKKQQSSVPPVVNSQIERLAAQVEQLKEDLEKAQGTSSTADTTDTVDFEGAEASSHGGEARTAPGIKYSSQFINGDSGGLSDLTQQNPLDVFRLPTSTVGSAVGSKARAKNGAPTIRVVVEEKAQTRQREEKEVEETFYMPAGSIITGVLLNGMDAPTGQGARNNPFPVTLRVQKEAILPNRFRADVRECFIVVSGYGDLSSERAYLRGETISCVREDGAIIESPLNSYAVGEDGKAGVRGRLVSKQGQVIARSLMAGFLSGLSKAFDVKPVPVIDTSNIGHTQFQRNEPNASWLQSAAASGASTALERVADFYLKMAEGMFPVIEVDAGRQVDLIINKGAKLQFRSMGVQK